MPFRLFVKTRAGGICLLYLVSYDAARTPEAFLETLAELGENLYVYPGAVLLNAELTAYGVRVRLLPYTGTNACFAVVQMYRGHCAGRLLPKQKEFVKKCILPDPALRFRDIHGRD